MFKPVSVLAGSGTEASLVYTLALPLETPSNNTIKGMHFHSYRALRKQWRLLVNAALVGQPRRAPLKSAFLVVTRECAGQLDWDNALGGLKPLLDCLVMPSARNPDGLGLVVDDSPRCMPMAPFMQQQPAKRMQGRTLVEIYELATRN